MFSLNLAMNLALNCTDCMSYEVSAKLIILYCNSNNPPLACHLLKSTTIDKIARFNEVQNCAAHTTPPVQMVPFVT